jgi:hypothetical protein
MIFVAPFQIERLSAHSIQETDIGQFHASGEGSKLFCVMPRSEHEPKHEYQ